MPIPAALQDTETPPYHPSPSCPPPVSSNSKGLDHSKLPLGFLVPRHLERHSQWGGRKHKNFKRETRAVSGFISLSLHSLFLSPALLHISSFLSLSSSSLSIFFIYFSHPPPYPRSCLSSISSSHHQNLSQISASTRAMVSGPGEIHLPC